MGVGGPLQVGVFRKDTGVIEMAVRRWGCQWTGYTFF